MSQSVEGATTRGDETHSRFVSRLLSRPGSCSNQSSDARTNTVEDGESSCRSPVSVSKKSHLAPDDGGSPNYHRIMIDGDEGDSDYLKCAEMIAELVMTRGKYKAMDQGQMEIPLTVDEFHRMGQTKISGATPPVFQTADQPASLLEPPSALALNFSHGVYSFTGMHTEIVPWSSYVSHIRAVYQAIEFGPCLSAARTRLTSLSEKFQLYSLLNSEIEGNADSFLRGGGVYARCTRVDNALRMRSSIPAPLLLNFIVHTAVESPRTPLYTDPVSGKAIYLQEYLRAGGVRNPKELTVEGLGLHPTLYRNKFVSYDVFDEHLNPSGAFGANLLQAVMSTNGPNDDNLCGAILRTELEKREFKQRQIIATEILLDIYGHHPDELPKLASWTRCQGFNKFTRNSWTLSVVRGTPSTGPNCLPDTSRSVADIMRHIFYPMMMASLQPTDPEWTDVAQMLARTGAISVLPSSSGRTENLFECAVNPEAVELSSSPGDYYFMYYVWANVCVLNALRNRLGLNTFRFTTAVHEQAPAFDQLVASFLLSDVVYHASSLAKSWIMQYLYMYCCIGIVMSPLRDNSVSVAYFDHPFVHYFQQGLRVSLSTSDPLHFHHRLDQPLMEEYATALKLRSLNPMDLCELARNSVLNSSFPESIKKQWLGENYASLGSVGNDMKLTGVCNYRLQYRHESIVHEETLLNLALSQVARKKGMSQHTIMSTLPYSQSVHVSDKVQQYRNEKNMNYADRRIVYPRIDIYGVAIRNEASAKAVESLRHIISLRKKYTNSRILDVSVEDVFKNDSCFDESLWEYSSNYGVVLLTRIGKSPVWPFYIPPLLEFIRDLHQIRHAISSGALRRLALHRLHLLERKFLLHLSMNISKEGGVKEEKEWNNRDFFTAYKVDTNVHTDAGLNTRTLLEFFVDKVLNHGDDVVHEEDQQPVTLRQILERYGINVGQITGDELHHQFKIHPDLRKIFLSTDNFMQGRYFAELTKCTLNLYQADAYSFAENRLNLYGESTAEWYQLAHWFDRYGMASSQNRWMISIPRQYRQLKRDGKIKDFGEFLDNIFHPLWEISLHPAKDTKFHYFLAHISGFDCVDDESNVDLPMSDIHPHNWNIKDNPPYNFYMYYLAANIATLNEFRASRGLSTFTFRPQCGEEGSTDHLLGGFLLTNGISHGVTLAQHPVLEYMYYLTQLGVSMSPLSNTARASGYLENPFPVFFHRGLNVSLATNKPLYFHFTREPLIEEYSIAAKLWRFEFNDLSEIARNSVLQCGFPHAWKERALGKLYQLRSTLGNDVRRSRLSDIRVALRYEIYHNELKYLDDHLPGTQRMPRAMKGLEEEVADYTAVMGRPPSGGARSSSQGELSEQRMSDKEEVAHLNLQLERLRTIAKQISGQNSSIAAEVNRLQSRLLEEGFVIMGGLQAGH